MNFRNRFPILLIALIILAFPVSLSAQNITGTIVGTIKDGSGAALPNATVTLTNVETNAQITVRPDNNGDFVAPSLTPGLYTVKTEATGFKQSVLKDTKIKESVTLQFRAEFFNLPNHANFGNPAANISVPSTVGRITGAGDPRQIQFGLKVLF